MAPDVKVWIFKQIQDQDSETGFRSRGSCNNGHPTPDDGSTTVIYDCIKDKIIDVNSFKMIV